jgi:hypothetical protein
MRHYIDTGNYQNSLEREREQYLNESNREEREMDRQTDKARGMIFELRSVEDNILSMDSNPRKSSHRQGNKK